MKKDDHSQERLEIVQNQAKKIMDDFIKALDKIDDAGLQVGQIRDKSMREVASEEKKDHRKSPDNSFRKAIFANAPRGVSHDFFVSEKKKWKS